MSERAKRNLFFFLLLRTGTSFTNLALKSCLWRPEELTANAIQQAQSGNDWFPFYGQHVLYLNSSGPVTRIDQKTELQTQLLQKHWTETSATIREVPPDVIFGLYELTLRLWKNGANSAVKCIRRLRLWACTHVEYGWVASVDLLQVSLGRRRCIRIRIRFVSISVAEPKVNV